MRFLSQRKRNFWNTIPWQSSLLLYLGVFLIFFTVPLVADIAVLPDISSRRVFTTGLFWGLGAALYAFVAIRLGAKWLIALLVLHGFFSYVTGGPSPALKAFPAGSAAAELAMRNRIDASLSQLAMLGSLSCLIGFLAGHGRRHLRLQTEMALARDLHRVLSPVVSGNATGVTFYGVSRPSGEVGGDLADVVVRGDSVLAYVADVSGHGVAAGVLMGILKSSIHMGASSMAALETLAAEVNNVLIKLKTPEMFATLAAVAFSKDRVAYCVAGHLPILHYRQATGEVEELSTGDLPLGLFADTDFHRGALALEPGDVFLITSDGVTEAEDRCHQEFGLARMKDLLKTHARADVSQASSAIMEQVQRHGRQQDDQTILLINCAAKAPEFQSAAASAGTQ